MHTAPGLVRALRTPMAAALLAASILLPVPGTAQTPSACGDFDASGAVVATDALLLLRKAVGQPLALLCPDCEPRAAGTRLPPTECGDVNGDGRVAAGDALSVLMAAVGRTITLLCPDCSPATTTTLCLPDCPDGPCGDDGCGGFCGDCSPETVDGVVFANLVGGEVPLAGAAAYTVPAAEGGSGLTDPAGGFRLTLPPGTAGEIQACAGAPGFADTCQSHTIEAYGRIGTRIGLTPVGTVLRGRVIATDGQPCAHRNPMFELDVVASVSIDGGPAQNVDLDGHFLFPGVTSGLHDITASCGSAQTVQTIRAADTDLDGSTVFDVVIANKAPKIFAVTASSPGALRTSLRQAPPGTSVQALVQAADPDGDSLTFKWFDDRSGLRPETSSSIDWQLHDTQAVNVLWVVVSDGKGGVAREMLTIATGRTDALFIGTVIDTAGVPIQGATVRVNAAQAVTDAQGGFNITTAQALHYALEARAAGFATAVRGFDHAATGILIRLPAAAAHVFNTAQQSVIADTAQGVELTVPAGALVDAGGSPVTGSANVEIHAFAATQNDPPPGAGNGLSVDGEDLSLAVRGGVSLSFRGPSGQPYRLGPGQSVRVTFPQPYPRSPDLCAAEPQPTTVAVYDPTAGALQEIGNVLLPSPPGTWSADTPSVDGPLVVASILEQSCVRVRADRRSTVVPIKVTLERHTGCFSEEGEPVYEVERELFVPDYEWQAINNLAADGFYRIRARPEGLTGLTDNGPELVHHFQAPPPVVPIVPPYAECRELENALARFVMPEVTGEAPALKYFNDPQFTWQEIAFKYYEHIGAFPQKTTFAGWLTANGFDTAEPVRARFFNNAELGIGRDVRCLKTGKNLACYIVKYGLPGGPIAETLHDTVHGLNPGDVVAIDSRANGTKLGFYVYDAAGNLKDQTGFNPWGPEPMPQACFNCHLVDGFRPYQGSALYFREGRLMPLDANTHVYSPELPRATQEESVRKINAMLSTMPGPLSQRSSTLIAGLYPAGVATAGAQAIDYVPPSYDALGAVGRLLYRETIRNHCQGCHLNLGPNWTEAAEYFLQDPGWVVCTNGHPIDVPDGYMPRSFFPKRNLYQGTQRYGLFVGLLGRTCLPPINYPPLDERPPVP